MLLTSNDTDRVGTRRMGPQVHRSNTRAALCIEILQVGKFTFRADFDSGNLNSVEPGAAPNEFMLRTNRDCGGTANEKATRTWFYFGVHGHTVGELLTMT